MTITIPAHIELKPGQYVRCDNSNRFLRIETYLTNGLGMIYQVTPTLRLVRVFF